MYVHPRPLALEPSLTMHSDLLHRARGGPPRDEGLDGRGIGYLTDMLVFALLISLASMLLAGASPVYPRDQSFRYAQSFAQSTLLAIQQATADEFGGFSYKLDTSGFECVMGGPLERSLNHKTLAQLLIEDALLNLRFEAHGVEFGFGPNRNLNSELRVFLESALDRLIGKRFGYRLTAKTAPLELGYARVYFETEIKDLDEGAQRKICSETVVSTLPIPPRELGKVIRERLGVDVSESELDPVVEITLELWSV